MDGSLQGVLCWVGLGGETTFLRFCAWITWNNNQLLPHFVCDATRSMKTLPGLLPKSKWKSPRRLTRYRIRAQPRQSNSPFLAAIRSDLVQRAVGRRRMSCPLWHMSTCIRPAGSIRRSYEGTPCLLACRACALDRNADHAKPNIAVHLVIGREPGAAG